MMRGEKTMDQQTIDRIAKLLIERRMLQSRLNDIEKELKPLRHALCANMHDSEHMRQFEGDEFIVQAVRVTTTRIDTKALRQEEPEIAARFERTSSYVKLQPIPRR